MPDHDSSTYIPVVKLTKTELKQFRINAPAALAGRGPGFVQAQMACIGEHVLTGAVALVGVLVYDWSIPSLVVFLLVGIWAAIVCDIIKYALSRAAVQIEAREQENHRRVWLVVDALRKGREEGRAVIARYPPGVGLFIDVALGSAATFMLVMGLLDSQPGSLYLPFQHLSFVFSLIVVVAYELAVTACVVIHHRFGSGRDHRARIDAGMRGVGLFLLLALTVSIGEFSGVSSGDHISARVTVLIAFGWLMLLGIVYGLNMVRMQRQTAWLRKYL